MQRGYHWLNASDSNGLNGEVGMLSAPVAPAAPGDPEGLVWEVYW